MLPLLAAASLFLAGPGSSPSGVPCALVQIPGGRPPAPPQDPAKAAEEARKRAEEEARKAAEKAAEGARSAADAAARGARSEKPPAVTPLPPPPPKDLRGGLTRAECAMVVVSADLSGKGDPRLKSLYDFAESAGAYLPGRALGDRYAEIVVLDKGNAKVSRFAEELDRLTRAYQAVDVVIHCHGDPFVLLWDDVEFDIYDFATQATTARSQRGGAAPATGSGLRLSLKATTGSFIGAEGGGGGAMLATARHANLWEKLRLLDLDGGALRDGDPVQLVTSDGHYVCAEQGGGSTVRGDRHDGAEWETFTLVAPGVTSVADGTMLSFKTRTGHYLGVAGGDLVASATQVGKLEKFTVLNVGRTEAALPVRPLSAQQRGRLRLVYETACFGASHAVGWRKLGFDFVAGARGVHCDSACSFPTFLGWWHNGCSFGECVDAANRADGGKSWDNWARPMFADANSQRLVRGNASGNYTTAAQ